MIDNIHQWLILRLVLAWLVLSLAIGGLVRYFGNVRLDNEVMDLAKLEMTHYAEAWRSYLESPSVEALAALGGKVRAAIEKDDMIVVEFYDADLDQITKATKSAAREIEERLPEHSHAFARQSDISCEKVGLGNETFLRVFVPIRGSEGGRIGYLEGIYRAPGHIVSLIKQETFWSLVLVVLVVLATTLVLYPLIIRLNRQLLEYSHSLMLTNVGMLKVLGSAIAKRDSDTNIHNYRVTLYSVHIEREAAPAAGRDEGADQGSVPARSREDRDQRHDPAQVGEIDGGGVRDHEDARPARRGHHQRLRMAEGRDGT